MDLVGELPDVPVASLPTIAQEVCKFGANVVFETALSGYVESISGRLRFVHDGRYLYVFLEIDEGHFPRLMIIGGTRQIVYESVELWKKQSRRFAARAR